MLQELADALRALLGLGLDAGDIGAGQMMLRAAVVYSAALVVVRLGSKRLMGRATAFDVILGIMIGSVMSRAINGSARMGATLAASAVLVFLHGSFARLAYRTTWFGHLVKGSPLLLIEDGKVRHDAMRQASLSEKDLEEAMRLEGMEPDAAGVRRAYLERDGTISVVRRKEKRRGGTPRVVHVAVADGVQTVRIEVA